MIKTKIKFVKTNGLWTFDLYENNVLYGYVIMEKVFNSLLGNYYFKINHLFVDENKRNLGYGRMLMEYVIKYFNTKLNIKNEFELKLYVQSTAGNTKGLNDTKLIKFYKSLGFKNSKQSRLNMKYYE